MPKRRNDPDEDLAREVRMSGLPDEIIEILVSILKLTRGFTRPAQRKIEKPWDTHTVKALIAFRKRLSAKYPNLTLLPFYVKRPKKSVWHCAWLTKRTGPGRKHPYAASSSLASNERSQAAS